MILIKGDMKSKIMKLTISNCMTLGTPKFQNDYLWTSGSGFNSCAF